MHCPYGDRCRYDHNVPPRQRNRKKDVENDVSDVTDSDDEKFEETKSPSRSRKHIFCKYIKNNEECKLGKEKCPYSHNSRKFNSIGQKVAAISDSSWDTPVGLSGGITCHIVSEKRTAKNSRPTMNKRRAELHACIPGGFPYPDAVAGGTTSFQDVQTRPAETCTWAHQDEAILFYGKPVGFINIDLNSMD